MHKLLDQYKNKKSEIKKRLLEFERAGKGSEKDIFSELCFCILTPQSKAVYCDKAVKELKRSGLLLKGTKASVKSLLKGVRFPNNKASYLISARRCFPPKIDTDNPINAREWLVKNIKGIGYKEASHFLRNIGYGKNLAILDVHILKNLKKAGILKKIPKTISKKTYLAIEDRMRRLSSRLSIPMDEIDLLFWSRETGYVFK